MDQLQAMRIFSRVAEQSSFTLAAEQMNLPRAGVTLAIQQLEKHVGARLLHRTTRKVTLTSEGAAYYDSCRRVLTEVDAADALFPTAYQSPRGPVRIDLPERLARLKIVPALDDFHARYPDIELRISVTDRIVDMIDEGIDCVVRVGELNDSRLVAKRIGTLGQITAAAPAYLQRHGTPQTLDDLSQHAAVNFFSNRTRRDLDFEFEEAGVARNIRMRGAVSVSSAEAGVACCLAGLGIAQAPANGLAGHIERGELIRVLADYAVPPMPLSVVYGHQRHLAPRVRVFVDWVSELLSDVR